MHLFTGTILGNKYALTIDDALRNAEITVADKFAVVDMQFSRTFGSQKTYKGDTVWTPRTIKEEMLREAREDLR